MINHIESLREGQMQSTTRKNPFNRNRIGLACPRKRLATDKLEQGREILNMAREGEGNFIGMIEAYLIIHNENSTKKEKIEAGWHWRNGALLHAIASLDPISKGKKMKRIPVFVESVEIVARETIRRITLEKGGTEEQAKCLEDKLTNMTKFFQIKSGVRNNTELSLHSRPNTIK